MTDNSDNQSQANQQQAVIGIFMLMLFARSGRSKELKTGQPRVVSSQTKTSSSPPSLIHPHDDIPLEDDNQGWSSSLRQGGEAHSGFPGRLSAIERPPEVAALDDPEEMRAFLDLMEISLRSPMPLHQPVVGLLQPSQRETASTSMRSISGRGAEFPGSQNSLGVHRYANVPRSATGSRSSRVSGASNYETTTRLRRVSIGSLSAAEHDARRSLDEAIEAGAEL